MQDINNFLISKKEILPTNSRVILETTHNMIGEQIFGQLNKGYTISPGELTVNTISEDDLEWGEKGLITFKFYETLNEEDYVVLTNLLSSEKELIVETFLYDREDNNEEYGSLHLTSDWSDVPSKEDSISYKKQPNTWFVLITIFKDSESLNFDCILRTAVL
jgi:hypothetical protein